MYIDTFYAFNGAFLHPILVKEKHNVSSWYVNSFPFFLSLSVISVQSFPKESIPKMLKKQHENSVKR